VTYKFDKQYINMTLSTSNTPPDYKNVTISYEIINLVELKQVQSRVKIYLENDAKEEDYTFKIFDSTIDKCRLYEGVQATFYVRAWLENINRTNKIRCPIPKDFQNKVVNLTITDNFLIPMPIEKRLRFSIREYAKISGRKDWTYLWEQTTYGLYQKPIF
jgi:hypothetical protein